MSAIEASISVPFDVKNNIMPAIGNTPLVKLNNIVKNSKPTQLVQ